MENQLKFDEFQREHQKDIEKITKSLNTEKEKFGQQVDQEMRVLKAKVINYMIIPILINDRIKN